MITHTHNHRRRRCKQQTCSFNCLDCGGCRTSCFGTPLNLLKPRLNQIVKVMGEMSEGVDTPPPAVS